MATAWLFHDSLVRQAPVSRQPSCYRVNLCHLIGPIIAFHQKYWSVDAALATEVTEGRGWNIGLGDSELVMWCKAIAGKKWESGHWCHCIIFGRLTKMGLDFLIKWNIRFKTTRIILYCTLSHVSYLITVEEHHHCSTAPGEITSHVITVKLHCNSSVPECLIPTTLQVQLWISRITRDD